MSHFSRPNPPNVFQLGDLVYPISANSHGFGIARGTDGKLHPSSESLLLPSNIPGVVGAAHYAFPVENGKKKVVLDFYLVLFGESSFFVSPRQLKAYSQTPQS